MKKKNLYEGLSKKSQKVKIAHIPRDKNDSSMNYLALSKSEMEESKKYVQKRLQLLNERINEPINSACNKSEEVIKGDQVIKELQEIQREAKNYDFMDLEKKIVLALGQRILYLEIENRKREIQKKKIKKQQIEESFFRHKKIKKLDYESLVQQKLNYNSYIARPYSTGKGFVQSDIAYRELQQSHLQRLQECQFLGIIKQVNKIYMNNYSYFSSHSRKEFSNGPIINLALLFCLSLFIFGIIILAYPQIPNIEYFMLANIFLILIILSIQGIRIYIQKPNHNNQLEQTKSDVKEFFGKINRENLRKGRSFQWICPEDFMYLEVHFES